MPFLSIQYFTGSSPWAIRKENDINYIQIKKKKVKTHLCTDDSVLHIGNSKESTKTFEAINELSKVYFSLNVIKLMYRQEEIQRDRNFTPYPLGNQKFKEIIGR